VSTTAARRLGISGRALVYWLTDFGLRPPRRAPAVPRVEEHANAAHISAVPESVAPGKR
jgi:hypothetical protein